jgi:hypothetical protein
MEVVPPSGQGVTFADPQLVELPAPGDPEQTIRVSLARGLWRPPEKIAPYLPEDFTVPLECYADVDGLRRIVPACTFEELIDLGAVGGLAVIHGLRGFDTATDFSYRAMRLIFEHVRGRVHRGTHGMKEHLLREFSYSRDLYIRYKGRQVVSDRDVLPYNFGQTAQGEGQRWSVKHLTDVGRREAQAAGCRNPTSPHAIPWGVYEAAKLNPLEIPPEEVPALVRTAIFEVAPGQADPDPGLIEIVQERLLEAIDEHLDEPREDYDRWFTGPANSLVKQIAQQKKKPGGRLRQEEVRLALLHLGWHSYEYVGPCVHALMRTIKNAIRDPLNGQERQLFEHMHESQPYYGNLPVALLAERTHFLRRAVLAIWQEPENREHVQVLHRLLQYYAQMADKRRQADRESKARASPPPEQSIHETIDSDTAHVDEATGDDDPKKVKHHALLFERLVDTRTPISGAAQGFFQEVADFFRQQSCVQCSKGCVDWEYYLDREEKRGETLVIGLQCRCGEVRGTLPVPKEAFAAQAKRIYG